MYNTGDMTDISPLSIINNNMLSIQERLRAWETRETKKGKEYEKDRLKEKKKAEEMEREGRKLKEFLEDYDDERDDPKFYKGRELQRRLADRFVVICV